MMMHGGSHRVHYVCFAGSRQSKDQLRIFVNTSEVRNSNHPSHSLYDSMTFLTKNPCIIGFLISEDNDNWFSIRSEDKITWLWQTSDTEHDMVYKQDIINKVDAICS